MNVNNQNQRLMTRKEILTLVQISRSTLRSMVGTGEFPVPGPCWTQGCAMAGPRTSRTGSKNAPMCGQPPNASRKDVKRTNGESNKTKGQKDRPAAGTRLDDRPPGRATTPWNLTSSIPALIKAAFLPI